MRRPRGQLLVELAVALPIILFVLLGTMEAGFLLIAKARQDRATAVVAQWAAAHPNESWNSVAERELQGCDVDVTEPRKDLLEATARCQYRPAVFAGWSGLPMTSRETAARMTVPDPETSPAASPSSSSTT